MRTENIRKYIKWNVQAMKKYGYTYWNIRRFKFRLVGYPFSSAIAQRCKMLWSVGSLVCVV